MTSVALFDTLHVVLRLDCALGNASEGETHLFTYLSCLLSLYARWPVSDWGYGFSSTSLGAPFSTEVHEAMAVMGKIGLITYDREYFRATAAGAQKYTDMRGLSLNAKREPFVEAACSSLLAFPVGLIRDALSGEPGLRRAAGPARKRLLLQESHKEELYQQFSALSESLGLQVADLMVPAMVWLSFLGQSCSETPSISSAKV